VDEYQAVRRPTIALFRDLRAAAWHRDGVRGNRITVRAIGYNLLGHHMHHRNIPRSR
jgi:hypothetical protein